MAQKKGQQHAQQSFAQLVGKANQEALKPYIHQVFANLANDLSQRLFTKLGIFQNRIEAIEKVLEKRFGITQNEVLNELFDIEDRVTGHQKVDRPAQEGDLLRLTMQIKPVGKDYGPERKKEFANLALPPYAMGMAFIEKALIGASVGETKVVEFDEDLKKQTNTEAIKFLVDRVSENIPKEEPKKEETPNAENPDASQPSGSPEAGKTE